MCGRGRSINHRLAATLLLAAAAYSSCRTPVPTLLLLSLVSTCTRPEKSTPAKNFAGRQRGIVHYILFLYARLAASWRLDLWCALVASRLLQAATSK
jgi:hypothetical protein